MRHKLKFRTVLLTAMLVFAGFASARAEEIYVAQSAANLHSVFMGRI
jgi:hypothetical protein